MARRYWKGIQILKDFRGRGQEGCDDYLRRKWDSQLEKEFTWSRDRLRVHKTKLNGYFTPEKEETSCSLSSSETQGQSVGSGERTRRKFSSTGERAPGYRFSPNYFQELKQMPAPYWAQKKLCIIVPNRWTVSYTTATVSITACLAHAPKQCTQSGNFQCDIKSPCDFKILSARKLKTLFQKYQLELTTRYSRLHRSRHVNIREFQKDTTTAHSRENVAWKSEFTFFQSLSWLFQLAYFVKCKRTLLELNFYQPYPSS